MALPRKTEDRAVAVLEEIINAHPTMNSLIKKGDKDLSWDGSIQIFHDDNCDRDKINYEGDVPVQVKGHEDKLGKYINKHTITYRVEVADLQNYYKAEGCLYFQIFLNEDGSQKSIFYRSLYPSTIKPILEEAIEKGSKSINIWFTKLHSDPKALSILCKQFLAETRRMGSGRGQLVPRMISASDLLSVKKMTVSSFGARNPADMMRSVMRGDSVLYSPLSGCEIEVPIQLPPHITATIRTKSQAKIYVCDTEYYSGFEFEEIVNSDGGSEPSVLHIIPSANIRITFTTEKCTVSFSPKSTLSTVAHDAAFIKALNEKKLLKVNTEEIDYSEKNLSEEQLATLNYYIDIGNIITEIGLLDDLSVESMSEENWNNLDDLLLIKKKEKVIKKTSEYVIYQWRYQGKHYPIIVGEKDGAGIVLLPLLYDRNLKVCVAGYNEETDQHVEPSDDNLVPTFFSQSADVLANLLWYDYELLFEQIERACVTDITKEQLNELALALIKAFDLSHDKQLLDMARVLLQRILDRYDDIHLRVNLLQIKYRMNGSFSEDDFKEIAMLRARAEREKEANDTKGREAFFAKQQLNYCISILEGNAKRARNILQTLKKDEKVYIKEWPINKLLDN